MISCLKPALVCAIAIGAAGCLPDPGEVCTQELGYTVTPSTATINVGQSFTGSMQLSTCGGKVHPSDIFVWQSDAPSIATVDALTGRVTGVAPGAVTIRVAARNYGVEGTIEVTVTP